MRRPERARALPDPAARLPRGDRAGARERGPRRRRDALVGRASARRARRAAATRLRGSRLVDSRARRGAGRAGAGVRAHPPARRRNGWYYGDALWRLRGFVDLLAGGVGLRRGRRDPETPIVGTVLDFWRVEALRAGSPAAPACGDAAARARLAPVRGRRRRAGSTIRQTAIFDPVGLAGLLYWYGLLPLHRLVFAGMLDGIARAATPATAPSCDRSRSRSDDAHRGRPLHARPARPRPPRAGGGRARLRPGGAALRPRRAARSPRARSATASCASGWPSCERRSGSSSPTAIRSRRSARFRPDAVYLSEDVSAYARRRVARLAEHFDVRLFPGITIVPPGELAPAGKDHYRVFTPYWRAWRERPLPAPVDSGPPLRSADAAPLSPHLHFGSISPAEVARSCLRGAAPAALLARLLRPAPRRRARARMARSPSRSPRLAGRPGRGRRVEGGPHRLPVRRRRDAPAAGGGLDPQPPAPRRRLLPRQAPRDRLARRRRALHGAPRRRRRRLQQRQLAMGRRHRHRHAAEPDLQPDPAGAGSTTPTATTCAAGCPSSPPFRPRRIHDPTPEQRQTLGYADPIGIEEWVA